MPVAVGANVITVTATDNAGNTASDMLTVTVDSVIYTLAEGATGTFFDLDIADRQSEHDAGAGDDQLPQGGRHDGDADADGRADVAHDDPRRRDRRASKRRRCRPSSRRPTRLPLVVERTMRWDATGYGAHTEKATARRRR